MPALTAFPILLISFSCSNSSSVIYQNRLYFMSTTSKESMVGHPEEDERALQDGSHLASQAEQVALSLSLQHIHLYLPLDGRVAQLLLQAEKFAVLFSVPVAHQTHHPVAHFFAVIRIEVEGSIPTIPRGKVNLSKQHIRDCWRMNRSSSMAVATFNCPSSVVVIFVRSSRSITP